MSDDTKINFSVEIKERHVAAAVISAIAHGMKKNMFQDKVREYVQLAMNQFFESNPALEQRIHRSINDLVNSRVEAMVYRALREAEHNLEKKIGGKVWCEKHGAVDPVLGCAVCQQDEAEAPRGTCTTGVEEEKS